jgi:pimeloyl-ACP methyl ester carboxylesterase
VREFTIDVPDAVLDDLRDRLARTRWPVTARGVGWDRGTDPDYLRELLAYWQDGYDWRRHEAALNALPQVKVDGVHAVHRRAADPDAPTLLLAHGWPDSFLRYTKLLPLLPDVHLVVPSLPGYGFSDPPAEPGQASRAALGERLAELMAALGYERYAVSGGDIGSGTVEAIAAAHPDRVTGMHLTDLPLSGLAGFDPADLTDAEREYVAAARQWQQREGAYPQLQATKPTTAAYGLSDSPAGLAGWLVEKFRSWSDDFAGSFPRDELLTHLTLYWVTNSIGSSFHPYADREARGTDGRLAVPTAVSVFPADLLRAPREFAERFLDVRQWVEHDRGGHFAALEVPELLVGDLRTFFRALR